MLTESESIERLWETGHFYAPGVLEIEAVTQEDLVKLTAHDAVVKAAAKSYQDLFGEELKLLAQRRGVLQVAHDGEFNTFTKEVLDLPRCGQPDFMPLGAVSGTGSWPMPCQKSGVKVHIDKTRIPTSLKDKWAAIQKEVFAAYAAIGLKLVEVSSPDEANIRTWWQVLAGSTIGIAQFNSGSCGGSVYCKLDTGYDGYMRSLWAHEMGHNCNLQHTNGGIMHPSIRPDPTPFGWHSTDPSYRTLVKYFGGEPIDPVTPPPVDPPPTSGQVTLTFPIKVTDAKGVSFNLIRWPEV